MYKGKLGDAKRHRHGVAKRRATLLSLAMMIPAGAQAQASPEPPSRIATPPGTVDMAQDIVVTARRRAESLQNVPVSITALSSDALRNRNVLQTEDLNATVPGFRLAGEGGKAQVSIVLRGLTQTPLGEGTPATVIYFDEIPIPSKGSNLPLYDLANVQVLKGPQGTLFGRNSLGGAVLFTPQMPTYDLAGYAKGTYGNYDYREFEGALNIPLVDDVAALRISGQIRRQDGTNENLSGGADFDDIDQNSFRAILLVEPAANIKNTLLFDYFRADEQPSANYLVKALPGVIPGLSPLIDGAITDAIAAQRAAGFHSAFTDIGNTGRAYRRQWAVQDKLEIDLGDVTLKNIFGYRRAFAHHTLGIAGLNPLPTVVGPFYVYAGDQITSRSYLSEEFQIQGKSLDNKLTWITGAYYSDERPTGLNGTALRAFSFSPSFTGYSTSLVHNSNRSLYAQGGLDLSDWVASGLTLNAGIRYSWDKVSACGGGLPGRYVSPSECKATANLNLPDGFGEVRAKGSAPSWTIGLDYRISDDVMIYTVNRRGYRGVNVNTPLFETPYTTGGVAVPATPGGPGCTTPGNICPDLRPFQTIKAEKLTDFEIGTKAKFALGDVSGHLNVSAFLSKYDNGLQIFNVLGTGIYTGAPDLPTQSSVGINADNETITGIEAELHLQPTRALSVTLNGAYTHQHVDKIIPPPIAGLNLGKSDITLPSPDFSGSASLSWTLPVRPMASDLILTADYFGTTRFGAQFGRDLPGYQLVNLRLEWRNIARSGIDLAGYVRNLFDEHYLSGAVVLSPQFPVNTAIFGAPRTYALEARVSF